MANNHFLNPMANSPSANPSMEISTINHMGKTKAYLLPTNNNNHMAYIISPKLPPPSLPLPMFPITPQSSRYRSPRLPSPRMTISETSSPPATNQAQT
jgi:hypothetical protein